MSTVTARVTGDKALTRTLKALSREFPKQAGQALYRTAKRTETRGRRQTAQAAGVTQKTIKRRFQTFRHGARGQRVSVWVGLRYGVDTSKLGRGSKRKGRAHAVRTSKRYTVKMPSGDVVEFLRLQSYARPFLDDSAREQMREYYPGELTRLVHREIKRRARRKR